MKTYLVQASETVFYSIRVEANSQKEARAKVFSGEANIPEAEDSTGFQIDDVQIYQP